MNVLPITSQQISAKLSGENKEFVKDFEFNSLTVYENPSAWEFAYSTISNNQVHAAEKLRILLTELAKENAKYVFLNAKYSNLPLAEYLKAHWKDLKIDFSRKSNLVSGSLKISSVTAFDSKVNVQVANETAKTCIAKEDFCNWLQNKLNEKGYKVTIELSIGNFSEQIDQLFEERKKEDKIRTVTSKSEIFYSVNDVLRIQP